MLPKVNRLTKTEIDRIKETSLIPFSGKYLGLLYLPGEAVSFGIILSTKISRSAVVRNKYRRLVYSAIQKQPSLPRGSYLFLAKRKLVEVDSPEIEADISRLVSGIV